MREDLVTLLAPGPRRDGVVAFIAGAFLELLTWSLEAKSALAPEELDALFHELAAPVLDAARLPGGAPRTRGRDR